MRRRFFVYIILAHLLVPIALVLPIHRIEAGAAESISFINIFEYLEITDSVYVTIFIAVFVFGELLGIANAIVGICVSKKHAYIRNAFALGFCSAILAAIFIGFGSYIFFIVCAGSFFVISYFALRLMKSE